MFLFLNFRRWKYSLFWAKNLLTEIWYLLITKRFLFWTIWRCEIRSFFEPKSWWKDDIYWLMKSSYFELFRDGKYGIFLSQKVDERWYLLITEKFLTVCSDHVTYAFQSESTLYICLNVKNSLLETGAISEV